MPIFGNDTALNSGYVTLSNNSFIGSIFTAPADVGEISKLTFYTAGNGATTYAKAIIVLHSDLSLVAVGGAVLLPNGQANKAWRDSSFAVPPTLIAEQVYLLAYIANGAGYGIYGDGESLVHWGSNNYNSPTDLASANHLTSKLNSIYATYTASASGPAKLKTWNGLEVAKIKTINGLEIAKVKTVNGLV